MKVTPLPFDSPLTEYDRQADELLQGWRAGDTEAVQLIAQHHPHFLRTDVPWAQKHMSEAQIRAVVLDAADARLALARWYDFLDRASLSAFAASVADRQSAIHRFEAAVEAVVDGNAAALTQMLSADPKLVHARSTRVGHFDPPVHRATLLHYVAANGVEGHRQRTPANAVEIATMLLKAGAEPDSLCDLYGGQCTTMALLVSSVHPARAGVQAALVETLVDFGAAVEPRGGGTWTSPLMTALAFGYLPAAEALIRRGARVETVAAAAALGREDDARRLLPGSSAVDRHRALALAAQHGHAPVVRLLLDAGEDPNRLNPEGNHAHSTPMHQAALQGHLGIVQLLVERGARRDIKDTIWNSTPLGWAEYCQQPAVAEYLRSLGS